MLADWRIEYVKTKYQLGDMKTIISQTEINTSNIYQSKVDWSANSENKKEQRKKQQYERIKRPPNEF